MPTAKKKTATKRKAAGTRTSSARSVKTPSEAALKRRQQKRQRNALIAVAVAVILLAILLVGLFGNTGAFGAGIKTVFFGLFGFTAFAIPVLLFYVALNVAADKLGASVKVKIFQGVFLLVLTCAVAHVIFVGKTNDNLTFKEIGSSLSSYFTETRLQNGGVLGALVGGLMLLAFDKVISIIIGLVLIALFLLLVSSVNLSDIIAFFRRLFAKKEDEEEEEDDLVLPTKKESEGVIQTAEQEKPKRPRFNVDVDLGDGYKDDKKKKKKESEDLSFDGFTAESASKEAPPVFDLPKEESSAHQFQIEDLVGELSGKKDASAAETVDTPSAEEEIAPWDDKPINQDEVTDKPSSPAQAAEEETVEYLQPPITLLTKGAAGATDSRDVLTANAEKLVDTLRSFGIETRILAISCGPAVTRYELQPAAGVKISRITSLADDIAMNLAASGVRIEAPIPNKHAIGIEVPNSNVRVVHLREVLESRVFKESKAVLSVALGKDIAGAVKVADLSKMPHLLIAGATGSGKSVCINSFIISLLYKATPDEVKLIMVDPKMVELGNYNGIPHLLIPVVTDPRKAAGALNWAVAEMTRRYNTFASHNVKDINSYNKLCTTKPELLPMARIVIIIDELADLMMVSKNEVEDAVCRLAQLARAAGMHLVLATQRPSVNVITGLIKANIPSRIAFAVTSFVDSRTILDTGGAEKLLGRGDMLFAPYGSNKPDRIQGCFVSEEEVDSVIRFVRENYAVAYDEAIQEEIEKLAAKEKSETSSDDGGADSHESDEKLMAAIEAVVTSGTASTSFLQRKLSLGYARAAKIMDEMEARGIIGPSMGSKPREVLMSRQQWLEMSMRSDTPITGSDNGDFE